MVAIDVNFMLDAVCLAAFSKSDSAKEILSSILEIYTATKKRMPDMLNKDLDVFFEIIQDIVDRDADLSKKAEINRTVVKLKNSPLAKKDPVIVDQLTSLLLNGEEIGERRVQRLLHRASNWVAMAKSMGLIKKIQLRGNQFNPTDDMTNDIILNDIAEYARDLVKSAEGGYGMSETIDNVDMSDVDALMKTLDTYKNKRKSNVFPTGLRALNRMLGKDKGFKRGESWAFAASSHNYKSQMLMNCARWCTVYGKVEVQPGMIPCVVLISLENEVPENANSMVIAAYCNAVHEEPPEDMPLRDIAERVARCFNANGIKLIMMRKDENFGYSDFVKEMEELKRKGYEIVTVIIDYITLMRVDEDSDNPAKRLQKLMQKLYNYGQRNNCLMLHGLQLDTRAEELNASGQANVVKSYGAVHLGDCKGFRRELSGLIFMYIEKNMNDVPYLTLAWSKHRDEPPPPKEDRYCAYRFMGPVLGIMDDMYLDKDTSVSDIYSDNSNEVTDAGGMSLFSNVGEQTTPAKPLEEVKEEPVVEEPKEEVTEPTGAQEPQQEDIFN